MRAISDAHKRLRGRPEAAAAEPVLDRLDRLGLLLLSTGRARSEVIRAI